jgi:predicted lipoprotein with Yx(FWY)xxD motif
MRFPRSTGSVLVVVGLLATACGGGTAESSSASSSVSASSTPAPATTSAPASTSASSSPPAADGTAIATGDSDYGVMLFDASGQAIYLFDRETGTQPACYGDCAADWPPVLTTGAPQATGDVQAGLLGTTQRDDGTTQVTYGGHPLYFYAHEDPGEVLCHDVDEYGGTWLVVTPEGTPAP